MTLSDRAAMLCSAYASLCEFPGDAVARDILDALGLPDEADRLACRALAKCTDEYVGVAERDGWNPSDHWALAECLLRTGAVK